MKLFCLVILLPVACFLCTPVADGGMIGLQNWADEVVSHTNNVQNYSGEMMATASEWWVLGPSDADVNVNGYAWDDGVDQDYVAGWRADAPGELMVVKFEAGLLDVQGDDLVIHMYCGPSAEASVWASVDNASYTQIGSIVGGDGPGAPGVFYDAEFDFAGMLTGDVHYVKVQRVGNGAKTGMFFDSFASTPVPEPAALALAVLGSLLIAARWAATRPRARRRSSR
jgi:hypothetical protein